LRQSVTATSRVNPAEEGRGESLDMPWRARAVADGLELLMRTRIAGFVVVLTLCVVPTPYAQERAQVTVWGGWTWSDGVIGNTFQAPNGEVYTEVDTKNSGSFGVRGGVFLTRNAQAGFMYGYQGSQLRVSGLQTREIGSIAIHNYHGYIGYHVGDIDQRVRPFAYVGLGATSFGSVDFIDIAGATRTIPGATKFSGTFGGGVDVFLTPRVGLQANARWTPTFITAGANSWWCDPYWGCYLGTGQYFNQVEFGGGLTVRF
jgi:hypothetical protein